MHNKLIVLLLFMTCTTFLAFSKDKKIQCDPKNRPESNTCFGEGATFENMCAYYKDDCPFEICGQPVSNACQACSDPKVLYYQKGDCKPEEMVSTCYEDICNPDFDPQQAKVFEPVCGFTQNCKKGQDCSETFENVCQACKSSGYRWYQTGVCQEDRNYCGKKKCLTSGNPVCAFFDSQDGGVLVHTTANDVRTACKDPEVAFYTKGACGPSRDDTTYCLPTYRPQACTREYNPVCGFYLGESGAMEHKVMSNPCTACADSSVIYHRPGPCVFKCDRNPFVIYECDGTYIEPVCGSYQDENGETKLISLKNSCVGCYNIPIKIDSYTDGLCPGDEGIRCENDAGGFLIGRISPVCGVFQEGCTDASCQQTFSESVVACSDPSVILFKPGMCPGDEGISCNSYRLKPTPENDGSFLSNTIYNDVCGYSQAGCTDSSCRATYTDQYEACANESVLFFNEGPCN